jgi:hypothetical protein
VKFLLPYEPLVIMTRLHWALLVVRVLRTTPVLTLGISAILIASDGRLAFTDGATDSPFLFWSGLILLLLSFLYACVQVLTWSVRWLIVSRRRVLYASYLRSRPTATRPLRRISDVTFQESTVGRLLGYGSIRFEPVSYDQEPFQLAFVPYAAALSEQGNLLLSAKDWAGFYGEGDDEGDLDDAPTRPIGPPLLPPATR